ncbi:MAG TPA: DsrE family protein [Chryseosolibacter sp.]|nr:DsrE family protein [Chryseosolibacter sp.]
MKTFISILFLCGSFSAWAQNKPVKIVFDITTKDTLAHQAVLRHVTGMAASYPQSQFEVIVYGGAIPMLISDKSTVSKDIAKLSGNKNVAFKVCSVTMKRYNVAEKDLLQGVVVVPDAILEIVNRQSEGWGYIKEAHN